METIRRAVVWAAVTVLVSSCATDAQVQRQNALPAPERTRRADVPSILVLMPPSAAAREAYEGLLAELGDDFDLIAESVDGDTAPSVISQIVRNRRPRAVVLMNNPILRAYRRYQVIAPPSLRDLPAIALLTSFLRDTSEGVENLTGVIYEVPLVTSLINLRALLDQPVRRIGVVYRPIFERFLTEQRRLASTEGFEIFGMQVSGENANELRQALIELRTQVDAIWILNDNRLLQEDMLEGGWLPALRRNRTPVIVNARSLVSSDVSFGTFAVLPDHRALGVQAAQMISTMSDQNWKISFPGEFEYPVAVDKVLDVKFARRNLALKEDQLATIDQLVE